MFWRISCAKNTVKVPIAAAVQILNSEDCQIAGVIRQYDFDVSAEQFLEDLVGPDGKFAFDSDHMEHMDFVWEEDVLGALKQHKAKGEISFLSNDGDNEGMAWTYAFDGNGGFEYRQGIVKALLAGKKLKKADLAARSW